MATSGRDKTGRFARTVEGAERDAAACRMRAQGVSLQVIADELGYASPANVHRGINQVLAEVASTGVDDLRLLEDQRLDRALSETWAVLGRARKSGQDERVLRAVDRLVRISERRSRLHGLDAAVAVTVHADISMDQLDAQIVRLQSELAELGDDDGGPGPLAICP